MSDLSTYTNNIQVGERNNKLTYNFSTDFDGTISAENTSTQTSSEKIFDYFSHALNLYRIRLRRREKEKLLFSYVASILENKRSVNVNTFERFKEEVRLMDDAGYHRPALLLNYRLQSYARNKNKRIASQFKKILTHLEHERELLKHADELIPQNSDNSASLEQKVSDNSIPQENFQTSYIQ